MSDDNRDFYLNILRSIVKTDEGYCLQKVYDEDKNDKMIETEDNKNNLNKNYFTKECYRCLHSSNEDCLLRTKLENLPENQYIPCHFTANCDAYSPVYPLNIIKSREEMVEFIEKVQNRYCTEVS